MLDDATEIRDNDIADIDDNLTKVLGIVRSVSTGIGAGLLAMALVGLAGAALLVRSPSVYSPVRLERGITPAVMP